MAWPSVLSAQPPPGADQANKAVTLQLVQQVSLRRRLPDFELARELNQETE